MSLKHVSHSRIQKRMHRMLIPAILIPLLFIGIFLSFYAINFLYRQAETQVVSDNLRAKSVLLDATLNFYTISEELFSDRNLTQLLITDYKTESEAISACNSYERLARTHANNSAISSILIYTDNPAIPNCRYIQQAEPEMLEQWFPLVSVSGSVSWQSSTLGYGESTYPGTNDRTPELTFLRSIPLSPSSHHAILVIKLSNNYLKNRIQNNDLFTTLSIGEQPVFFSSSRFYQGQAQPVPIDFAKKGFHSEGFLPFQGEKQIGCVTTLPAYHTEGDFYLTTIDLHAKDSIYKIGFICLLVLAAAMAASLFGLLYSTRYFSRRVTTLQTAMGHASQGNYDIIDTFKGDDELTDTFLNLKIMIGNIKQQELQMYEARIKEQTLVNQQQQMEYKLLASQINPHFIYNSLETIRMMSIGSGDRETASAIKLLGKTMHYVLENTGTASTTLDKELDYISSYLAIQKLRFEERFNYTIHVPPELSLSSYKILPLLLQPIVENAILHGLEEKENGGRLTITLHTEEENHLLITIEDNGKGMTGEELQNLKEQMDSSAEPDTSGSIGLCNISRRIRLIYGPPYSMDIASSPDGGTSVYLLLPLLPAD